MLCGTLFLNPSPELDLDFPLELNAPKKGLCAQSPGCGAMAAGQPHRAAAVHAHHTVLIDGPKKVRPPPRMGQDTQPGTTSQTRRRILGRIAGFEILYVNYMVKSIYALGADF